VYIIIVIIIIIIIIMIIIIERVVNVWNRLPAQIDFASLSSFTRTVKKVDLSF